MSIRIQSAIWQYSKVKGAALLVLLAIGDFADDNGVAFPSVQTLAEKARVKERCVQYALREIQDSGELSIEAQAGPKGCNLFRVHIMRGANDAPVQTATENGGGGCKAQQKGVHRRAPKPSGTVSKKEPSIADARHQPFIAWLFEQHPGIVLQPPDFRNFKTLLEATTNKTLFGLEKLKEHWERFIHSPDKFVRQQGVSLRFFCLNINQFTGTGEYAKPGAIPAFPRPELTPEEAAKLDEEIKALRATMS